MIRKYIIPITAILSLASGLLLPSVVFAKDASHDGMRVQVAQQITQLKRDNADKEIDRRVEALNTAISRLNDLKRLTTDDKSGLTKQIQDQIVALTNLKAKIDTDTDAETLKTDKQAIVNQYRIFLLFIPKTHILAAVDALQTGLNTLNSLVPKLQARIQTAQSAGLDVTQLNVKLQDMQNKLADAKTQLQNAQTIVTPLTPDGFPGNKPQLLTARKDIQVAYTDLIAARNDAKFIIDALHSARLKSATPSATASSSASH